eukprot:CAMPEP_0172712086 /NCGR_PEP_ID=MMETSP1074-20121228/60896_1 /TAXON_ID=2916 /ORGANISM="Ceratium fusus, Strain PA161109" /LENGTH=265 /DNA_ID=CAMNT_0013535963 /DNA_START=25 /DNA_END=822 /DNA_ORIENTATION=+
MEGTSMVSEYLCTLEPRGGSQLARTLAMCRTRCRTHLDVDETMLYPLHISVTGFFSATEEQANGVCSVIQRLLAAWTHSLDVEVQRVVPTDTGYVLLDVTAAGIAELATTLADQARPLGVQVRPKAVRHLSLASRRVREEQVAIAEIHEDVPLGLCAFDLVVSQLLRRSDIDSLRATGQVHVFRELVRLPLPGSNGVGEAAPSRMCIGFEVQDAVTPMRKRRAYYSETDEAPPWRWDLADTTPIKVGVPSTLQAGDSAKVQRRNV